MKYLHADTNLLQFLNVLNWNSGSVSEVNEEVSNCLEREIDISKLEGQEFRQILAELKLRYPAWLKWGAEDL